jgi:hypothetical protein
MCMPVMCRIAFLTFYHDEQTSRYLNQQIDFWWIQMGVRRSEFEKNSTHELQLQLAF